MQNETNPIEVVLMEDKLYSKPALRVRILLHVMLIALIFSVSTRGDRPTELLLTPLQVPDQLQRFLDISIIGTVSPSRVPSGDNATYSFAVSNNGPDIARNVIFVQDLPGATGLVSAVPSSGICHRGDGHPIESASPTHETTIGNSLYCNVGDLASGGTVSIAVVVRTSVFGDAGENEPMQIKSEARVASTEIDSNEANNSVLLTFDLLPSPDSPPIVRFVQPQTDQIFVAASNGTTEIPIEINASDSDGTISEVRVYEAGDFVGIAKPAGNNRFFFNMTTTKTGYHSLSATAEDSGGRTAGTGNLNILINSAHTISIVKPTVQLVSPGSSVEIETRSSLVGGRIQKIELYNNGLLVGKMRAAGSIVNMHSHRFTLVDLPRGSHSFTAILTDLTGAITISQPMNFKVTVPPTISITSPQDSAIFASGASIDITVQTGDADGYVQRLNFYASGRLIGSTPENIVKGSSTFRWISPDDGVYSIVVTATDDTDETVSSNKVNIRLGPTAPPAGDSFGLNMRCPKEH